MPRRFSIVIVHRNGVTLLRQVLVALRVARNAERDEILVVDNGSSDGSPEMIARDFPETQLIRNSCNNGFARACNQAIGRASGEFLLLLNNDAFPAPDVLDRFEDALRTHPRCAVVAGQLVDAQGRAQHSARRIPTALDELGLGFLRAGPSVPQLESLGEVEGVVGACMAVRAEAIRDAGSLDNDFFFYYEETEWCHRLRRRGWSVMLEPQARVTHLKGASTAGRRRGAQVEMLRSRFLFYRKTMAPPLAVMLSAYRVLRLLVNGAVHLGVFVLTAGMWPATRERLLIYGTQLAWLASGCPASWGLPDKCPPGYPEPTA